MGPEVAIIGAGISGLSVAFFLKRAGVGVLVLEAEEDVGGTMRSRRLNGYLVELGPNSALETTPLFQELIAAAGLADERVYASEAARNRYIFRDGELHPLPLTPLAFLRSRLWSWKGKLRVLAEPFHGRVDREESVADFVRRRVGREFLDYAVNPFVAGIYAGDPERLSVRFAFPQLYALEALSEVMHEAYAWGAQNLPSIVQQESARTGIPLPLVARYLQEVMVYRIDARFLEGLERFRAEWARLAEVQ